MTQDHENGISSFQQQRILRLLRQRPGISRADLARRTGLGKATISTIVSKLIDEQVLQEDGAGEQLGPAGRRPVRLRINGDYRLAIGVELTGSECVAVLTNLYGEPLQVVRHPVRDRTVETAIEVVGRAVDELRSSAAQDKLLGVGVGAAGMIGPDRQTVIQAVNSGWFNVPLGSLLKDRLGTDVIVIRRQSAGALGEYWHGAGKGKPILLYVSIGVGIGSGILVRGQTFGGAVGSAGEIGHMTILPDGDRCNCGNRGCLETVASSPAMAMRARQCAKEAGHSLMLTWSNGVAESITLQTLFGAARAADQVALEVVRESAIYVGIALANFVNLFSPSMIVIGGEVLPLGELFLAPLRQTVRSRALSTPGNAVEIAYSALGDLAAAIGAGMLVIDQSFSPALPEYTEVAEGIRG